MTQQFHAEVWYTQEKWTRMVTQKLLHECSWQPCSREPKGETTQISTHWWMGKRHVACQSNRTLFVHKEGMKGWALSTHAPWKKLSPRTTRSMIHSYKRSNPGKQRDRKRISVCSGLGQAGTWGLIVLTVTQFCEYVDHQLYTLNGCIGGYVNYTLIKLLPKKSNN